VIVSGSVSTSVSGDWVTVASGLIDTTVTISSGLGVLVSGQWVEAHIVSGNVTVVSGPPGLQISGAVQVSGTVAVSGLVGVQSGEVHILSGAVTVISGPPGLQVSGAVVVSGEVSVQVPDAIMINSGYNPQIIYDTATILQSGPSISVIVKSLSTNSGDIYLGGYNATSGNEPISGVGFLLEAGNAINIDIENIGYITACAAMSGDKLTYLANCMA